VNLRTWCQACLPILVYDRKKHYVSDKKSYCLVDIIMLWGTLYWTVNQQVMVSPLTYIYACHHASFISDDFKLSNLAWKFCTTVPKKIFISFWPFNSSKYYCNIAQAYNLWLRFLTVRVFSLFAGEIISVYYVLQVNISWHLLYCCYYYKIHFPLVHTCTCISSICAGSFWWEIHCPSICIIQLFHMYMDSWYICTCNVCFLKYMYRS
jgi:hypothetical protein